MNLHAQSIMSCQALAMNANPTYTSHTRYLNQIPRVPVHKQFTSYAKRHRPPPCPLQQRLKPLHAAATSDSLAPVQYDSNSPDFDTIAAVVTGTGGAVSIIRLSGDDALDIASMVFQPTSSTSDRWQPESHRVYYGHAIEPNSNKARIDEVLVLVMKGPRSYTAEDVVELHTHGGGLCAQRVLRACISAGARLAKPGEFTLRAFLNGRLDLSQAESVAQLVEARTVAAADSALAGLNGALGKEVQHMRRQCLELLAELEARIDFDEDLPAIDLQGLVSRVGALNNRIQQALSTARHGQLLRTGLQVAIVGRPNVGKSSLLNALSGVEKAIVTDIAGTTRDVVEAGVVIGGVPVTLLDTAGLREATDQVEKIGVERSVAAAQQADVVVMVVDSLVGWQDEDQRIFDTVLLGNGIGSGSGSSYAESFSSADYDDAGTGLNSNKNKTAIPSLLVVNKVDSSTASNSSINNSIPERVKQVFSEVVYTSAMTGQGLGDLRNGLLKLSGAPELAPGGIAWAVNERQAEALMRASESLSRVEESIQGGLPIDFWTIDVRSGLLALGEVSGDDATEEVLDAVFSTFCIGK